MRAVGLSDLDLATRVLVHQARKDWRTTADDLIRNAHCADLWRKRYGVAHPGGGTGSLYAQACLLPRAPSSGCDARYCAALACLLAALEDWRGRVS